MDAITLGTFTLRGRSLLLCDPGVIDRKTHRRIRAYPGLWVVKVHEGCALEAHHERFPNNTLHRKNHKRDWVTVRTGRLGVYCTRHGSMVGLDTECPIGEFVIYTGKGATEVVRLTAVWDEQKWREG